METWLAEGHWQWLRGVRGEGIYAEFVLWALGGAGKAGVHHCQCAKWFAAAHPLSPIASYLEDSSSWQLSFNCSEASFWIEALSAC